MSYVAVDLPANDCDDEAVAFQVNQSALAFATLSAGNSCETSYHFLFLMFHFSQKQECYCICLMYHMRWSCLTRLTLLWKAHTISPVTLQLLLGLHSQFVNTTGWYFYDGLTAHLSLLSWNPPQTCPKNACKTAVLCCNMLARLQQSVQQNSEYKWRYFSGIGLMTCGEYI